MDITKSIHRINQALNDVPIGKQPKELYEPMEYMIQLDRQRHYPLLALWGSYLFAGTYEIALIPSIGVEVFHSFLMVHEDILDRNASRNNSLCVHEKWNNNVAILSGDAMIFKAYELLIQVEPRLVTTVIRKFNYCFTKICEGKQLAINHPGLADDPKILKLKPGALSSFSLQLGAIIAGASPLQLEAVGAVGSQLGIWFGAPNYRTTIQPLILQSIKAMQCDENRKRQFEQWVIN
jgi:geranylgeranyl diphosphate synthase type II